MQQQYLSALIQLGEKLKTSLSKDQNHIPTEFDENLQKAIRQAEVENNWFTQEYVETALSQWASVFKEKELNAWLSQYNFENKNKKVGLILAGNIPLVGFHDVLSVILSGNTAVIKLSSKDKVLIPFLLENWSKMAGVALPYIFAEKMSGVDAMIATGSNNTAQYLAHYFRDVPNIIRKNRTSVAVLEGNETDEEINLLAKDIFTYFGKGCRNVTHLVIPQGFELARLFENFMDFAGIINHHSYANNYDYNKAIFLLNQDQFWDNNFVMLRENESLFSPMGVLNFTYYKSLEEAKDYLQTNQENIQAVISNIAEIPGAITLGSAQDPGLDTYADGVDTLAFLTSLKN